MQTAITISDPLFAAAEAQAASAGLSRDELYSRAIQEYLERRDGASTRLTPEEITTRLDQVYESEDSTSDRFLERAQNLVLPPGAW